MVYFTLPLDSSMDYFPDNTIAKYRVKLPREYEFDGDYECGLIQLLYPVTWHTLSSPDMLNIRVVVVSRETSKWIHKPPAPPLKPGYYRDIGYLLWSINQRLATFDVEGTCSLDLDDVTQKVKFVYSGTLDVRVKLHGYVREMLGFDRPTSKWLRPGDKAVRAVDLRNGFHNIYVYSDLIQPTHVTGHTLQPLLRSVPVQGNYTDMVLVQPMHIQYFPLRAKRVQTVEVLLATDLGTPVPFESGKSQITVHIRRARPLDL